MSGADPLGGPIGIGRRGRALLAVVLSAGVLGVAACGDDDEEAAPATGTTDATEEVETTTVPESVAPPPAGPESEPSGGVSSDQPTDPDSDQVAPEDTEGGAGDEANDPIDGDGSGGGGSGGGGSDGSGGSDPQDEFEQFCEENPRACE